MISGRLLGAVLLAALACGPASPQNSKVDKLKGTLNKVKSKSSNARSELKKTRTQVRHVKGDINDLDARLTSLEKKLDATNESLGKSLSLQRIVTSELAIATKNLDRTREQVRTRLRWMYMRRKESVASVLVDSKSLGDFASRSFLLKRVAQADRDLFERFRSQQNLVAAKKIRADRLVVEVTRLKIEQESRQESLNESRLDKKYLLDKLRDREDDLERVVRQLDAEEDAIRVRIAAYQRSRSSGSAALPKFSGRFGKPVSARMTSGYGMRYHPILKRRRMHTGVDFGAPSGSPIYAAADGVVISASYSGGYGNAVILDHGGGVSTLYAHCSRFSVSAGQSVRKGQRIASVGSTGLSTGPHLHFEVRVNGRPVNPMGRI
jgi:murein DD-endopeptidase MepM/ murein hydrolase activator NlpD